MNEYRRSLLSLAGPKYWPVWLGFGLMRAACVLPFPLHIRLGRLLGRAIYRLAPGRRAIALRNLELCFPEFTEAEIGALLKRHFESFGASIAEVSLAWWAGPRMRRDRITFSGGEHIDAALAKGKGVILVAAHYTAFEMAVPAMHAWRDRLCGMYRPNDNNLANELIIRGWERGLAQTIPKRNVRGMIRALRDNMLVWYAPDQGYRRKNSALVRFFHELAPTSTTTSRIAKATGATVILLSAHRLPDDSGYIVEAHAPLENFPSEDPEADTRRINEMIEEGIRKAPDQYYWTHRRFKKRPHPLPDLYADI